MFTNLLGPVMDAALNHYHIPLWFKAVIPGQTGSAVFDIDYRQVWSPLISTDGYADFRFSGEFIHNNENCTNFYPKDVEFLDIAESHLVMTDTAVNCIFEQVAKTPLGTFELNTRTLESMVNGTDINTGFIDSTRLKSQMPILAEKLGEGVPL